MQDKDFKRLNKSALGMRATTSHVSILDETNLTIPFFSFSNNTSSVKKLISALGTLPRSEMLSKRKLVRLKALTTWGLSDTEVQEDST